MGRSFLVLLRITGILYVVRGLLSPVGGGGGDLFVAREPKYGDKKPLTLSYSSEGSPALAVFRNH